MVTAVKSISILVWVSCPMNLHAQVVTVMLTVGTNLNLNVRR